MYLKALATFGDNYVIFSNLSQSMLQDPSEFPCQGKPILTRLNNVSFIKK